MANTSVLVAQIAAEIKAIVNQVMAKVAEEIQKDLANRAVGEVYGAYSPEIYARRYSLSDAGSYSIEVSDLMIAITPVASFNRAYGGWNHGDELGGFMNFGRGWHGYVMGRGASGVPLPRPYLETAAQYWDGQLQNRIRSALGPWAECVTAHVTVGGGG